MKSEWYLNPCASVSEQYRERAKKRQNNLTKPAGSLGKMEHVAEQFAAWQAVDAPLLDKILVRVYAADHGICAQNISAFPQQVTTQMVSNFIHGGAAISVLSSEIKADFAVVTLGLVNPLLVQESDKLIRRDIAAGTADFSQASAMTKEQLEQALEVGGETITDTQPWHIFVGGEMGIGNTTSAAAIYSCLLHLDAEFVCGPGTGLDATGINHKADIVRNAVQHHSPGSALEVLQTMGGFEIAALVGAYIRAAQCGIPSLIDGYICTAAALVAVQLNPSCRDWMIFSHVSAEPAHTKGLQALNATALLDLGLRLGEGSGSALAIPVLQSALCLHNNMATFAEAEVAGKIEKSV